jgi:hypothetical protein
MQMHENSGSGLNDRHGHRRYRSDREIAKETGVNHRTVAAVRQVSTVEKFSTVDSKPITKKIRILAELEANPNRSNREIAKAAGVSRYDDITSVCPTEDRMRKRVAALNQHCRSRTTPITNEEKRMRTAAELKANPNRSDREIAKAAGVDHKTVGAVSGEFPHLPRPGAAKSEKRQRLEAELAADPTRSDWEIAKG